MVNRTQCLELIENGAVGQADPDISGLGVISAFVLSACLTLAAVVGAYVFGLVDEGLLRPVDKLVMRVPSRARRHPKLHVTLRKAVMTLSDQQIVTGIAILGAGFQRLQSNQITVYHFHLVIYLAWMSSSVHLSALTLLRPYLNHHRGVLAWRIMGMLVLLVMLLVALVPTVSNDWAVLTVWDPDSWQVTNQTAFGVPAKCFWGWTYGDGVNPDAVISFLVLFISYVWKMGGLFMPVRAGFERFLRNPTDSLLEWPLQKLARHRQATGGFVSLWAFRIYLAFYLSLTSFLEVLGSFTAAIWVSVLGLIYGTMQIVIPRELVQWADPVIARQESALGFGQLVPLILLVQPLGACTEHFWLRGKDDEEVYEEEKRTDSPASVMQNLLEEPSKKDSFIGFMAEYTLPSRSADPLQRAQLKAFLYSSKLFIATIWFVQLAVAGTSALIFYIDADSIGWVTSDSWYFISTAVGGYLGVCLVGLSFIAPFSRLGRSSQALATDEI